ncbi:MAG: KEOPS complex kinase/ATPase Bud32 [Candidatus Pacearchaeota archaeon]
MDKHFQGAEAKITFSDGIVTKDRLKKSYRISEIDEKIRKRRTKSEEKLLTKASEIIDSPKPFAKEKEDFKIKMPFIKGKKLSQELENFNEKKKLEIFKEIGKNIAKLHDSDIIHGDLTTSNLILTEEKKLKVHFIDFGLGFISRKIEDKAVDLHLLRQALEAKHFQYAEELFKQVLEGYEISENFQKVLERLKAVEKRGRYKENY